MSAHALYLVTVNNTVYRTLLVRCGVRNPIVFDGMRVQWWLP